MNVQAKKKYKIIYDGHCRFCRQRVGQLKFMDFFAKCKYIDYHTVSDVQRIHPSLNQSLAASQLQLITPNGKIYGGFFAFRQICWIMPMLYPLLLVVYLPLMSSMGPKVYRSIAQKRHSLS